MTRASSLMDEAIHLAGACLELGGFPHVIGSLWQIDDFTSSTVAKDVYKVMCRDGRFDATLAAEGLHFAVRRLRGEPLVTVSSGTNDWK
jgi:CHAT domain-containing protein